MNPYSKSNEQPVSPSSGQGRLTEVAQALIQREARGGLCSGKQRGEAIHAIVCARAAATANGERSGVLAVFGLPGEGGQRKATHRLGLGREMIQKVVGCEMAQPISGSSDITTGLVSDVN